MQAVGIKAETDNLAIMQMTVLFGSDWIFL